MRIQFVLTLFGHHVGYDLEVFAKRVDRPEPVEYHDLGELGTEVSHTQVVGFAPNREDDRVSIR